MGPGCHKCRVAIPYNGLAAALEAWGFQSGTLIASDRHEAGNLRCVFPEARIVCLGRPGYAPPLRAADLSSKVAVVWRKPEQGSLPAEAEPEYAKIAGNAAATPERLCIPWQPYLIRQLRPSRFGSGWWSSLILRAARPVSALARPLECFSWLSASDREWSRNH
jgi:hypothetical protein